MTNNKKGQVAMEFLFYVGLGIVIMLVAVGLIFSSAKGELGKEVDYKMQEIAENIEEELVLAMQVHNGYERTIYVPESYDYNLSINRTNLYFRYEYNSHKRLITLRIPEVEGQIIKGYNTIKKLNGTILIEQ